MEARRSHAEETLIETPNSLRHGKLNAVVARVIAECQAGNCVTIQNMGDHAVSVAQVAEEAKQQLQAAKLRVFQQNSLLSEPVYAPEPENEPLAKKRIHHYALKFTVKLSLTPIDAVPGATEQVCG